MVLFGLVGVLSALLAARGPAVGERAVYTWPPAQSPSAMPKRSWFTPMFLARREAQKLAVDVPCGRRGSFSGAADRVLVVATARDTALWNGLEVTRSSRPASTLVRVGDRTLARLPSPTASCILHLRFEGLRWSVDRDRERIESGTLELPVGVTGLFTHLDIRRNPGLRVTVRPYAQDTRPSDWQTVFRIIAALSIGAAVLVSAPLSMKRSIRVGRPRVSAQDVAVGLCLTTYWILAPLQDDDGWVRARQTNYLVSGGFSSYYQHQGVNLPLVTWFEWLQHFAVAHTGSLVVNRLPSVAILAATWLVCRTCLYRVLGRPASRRDVAWWSAAAAFALGAAAFGITLRPEPPIALLAAAVLACCLRYASAPNPLLLIAAVLLSGAAVTIHHSGAIAAAPLLVSIPRVYSNARRRIGSSPLLLLGIALVGVASTLLLAFVDGDLRHRLDSIDITGTTDPSTGKSPLQEFERYRRLLEIGSTPLRREFVVLLFLCVAASVLWGRVGKRRLPEMLLAAALAFAVLLDLRQRPLPPEYIALLVLCVAAWVLWRVGKRSLPEKLPAASLAVALLLLTLTPSKWIWHFGALLGLGAVAVGVEANRLAIDRRSWVVRSACALAVLASALWAAQGSFQWTTFQTGSSPGWNDVPYVPVVVVTTVVAIIGSLVIRRRHVSFRPELVALFAAIAALLGTTTIALAVEAGRTPGWTAAQQAVSGLLGKEACGMATGLTVAVPDSMRPLAAFASNLRGTPVGRMAASGGERATLDRTTASAWFRLPRRKLGLLVTPPRPRGDELVVTWGRSLGRKVQALGSGALEPDAATEGFARSRRVLIGERSFPPRPADADVVRVETPRGRSSPPEAASWQFVSYGETRLDRHMRQEDVSTLVTPYLLEGFPCVTLPPLEYGVAGVPDLIVEGDLWDPAVGGWSPFAGATDVYDVVRVPVENWDFGRGGLYVYWVVRDPSDALALPTRRIVSS